MASRCGSPRASAIAPSTSRRARPTARGADGRRRSKPCDGLDDAARALIAAADTFFVASRSRPEVGSGGGLDMSHRGGRPGFVGVHGDTLAIPDFRGNRFFNTLGNLLGDPRAGLLFVDFASGDLLQLQGRADDRLDSRQRRPGRRGAAVAGQGRARLAPARRLPLRLDLRRLRADDAQDGRLVIGAW